MAAGIVRAAGDWPWSSYRAHVGLVPTPPWLDSDGLHGYLLNRAVAGLRDRAMAARRYATLVDQGDAGEPTIWQAGLRQQVYLGDTAFVERMQALASQAQRTSVDVPKPQRKAPLGLQHCMKQWPGQPAQALRMAYRDGGMTMTALARDIGLSVSRVSRLIASAERTPSGAGRTPTDPSA